MELDDLKNAAKAVRAPEIRFGAIGADLSGTESLLRAIRENDENERKQTRKALPFYLLAGALYAFSCGVFFVGSTSGSITSAVHLGVLAMVFMIVSFLMQRKLLLLRGLDYATSAKAFLAETENRYRFMRPLDYCYSVPLIAILGVTGGLSVVDSLIPRYFAASKMAWIAGIYSLFFAVVCGMGYYFSYKNWKRDKGKIFKETKRMRQELEATPRGQR